ncbi:44306_t:CDS:2, partial [Gigaspora margarita]
MSNNIPTFSELLAKLFLENAAAVFLQNHISLNLALTNNMIEQSYDLEIPNIPIFSEPLPENAAPVFSQNHTSLNFTLLHNMMKQSHDIEISNISKLLLKNAAPVFSQNHTLLDLSLIHNMMEQSHDIEISNIPTFSELLAELLPENAAPVFSQLLNLALTYDMMGQSSDMELTNNISSEQLVELLPDNVVSILSQNYNYIVSKFQQLPNYITPEGFSINQFKINFFVNINNIESIQQWFSEYEEISKTTMPKTKGFQIQGKKVIHRELCHCIHSNIVKQKQGSPIIKNANLLHARNTECIAIIHLRLEYWHLQTTYPLEHVKEDVRNNHFELFANRHSLATARHTYEDMIYLHSNNDQKLVQLSADRAQKPDYGKKNFRLKHEVDNYNNSGQGCAILQEYNSQSSNAFILYIVTNLMSRVYEKIRQSNKLCHVNASASFELLNISITLFYTSCIAGALPLGLIIISDELKITLEKGFNLLKELLLQHAFFNRESNAGPMIFLTDDSRTEQNVLKNAGHSQSGYSNSHPGYLQIAKQFLYPEWDKINAAELQQSEIDTEYLVPSQKFGTNLFYTVNIEICTCTCFIGLSGAPYKHQAKDKSIPALTSFLYDINRNIDPFACVKSGSKIRVQVELV